MLEEYLTGKSPVKFASLFLNWLALERVNKYFTTNPPLQQYESTMLSPTLLATIVKTEHEYDMSTVDSDETLAINLGVGPGMYVYCHECGEHTFLTDHARAVFFTVMCDKCSPLVRLEQQASVLTDESHRDINSRANTIKGWLMSGNKHGTSVLSHYLNIPELIEPHINLLEDICILVHYMMMCDSTVSRYVAVVNFCKLRGSRLSFTTTLGYIITDIFGDQFLNSPGYEDMKAADILEHEGLEQQSEEIRENVFTNFRKYLGMYDKLKETSLYKKLYKFMLYMLTMGLLGDKITFESLKFQKFEIAAVKASHQPGFDMVHCMLDTVSFVCERGLQWFQTGDVSCMFQSGSSYDAWLVKANKLIRDAKLMNNPEPHGINKFTFHSELLDTIEKGKGIVKFTAGLEKYEKMSIQRILFDLQLIEANEITRRSAQEPRKDPFAVLLHGSSSICKSQLKQIMFYHYGKVFGLPTRSEFMYTRCPTDEFWSGFNSTQWCIVMDDIAFLRPNGGEIDPTLAELLQVKNSVAYTPPQAALEDKGRTPVKAELLIGTTNTKNLNLFAYFACPFAVARRLPYVITASVKPQFTKCTFMADSQLIPITPEGEYMNIWDFDISVPVPAAEDCRDNQQTKYVSRWKFTDINDMLVWYIGVAKEHEVAQAKAMCADNTMQDIVICKVCFRTEKLCICVRTIPSTPSDPVPPIPLEPYGFGLSPELEIFMEPPMTPQEPPPDEGLEQQGLVTEDLGISVRFWLKFYHDVIRHDEVDLSRIWKIVAALNGVFKDIVFPYESYALLVGGCWLTLWLHYLEWYWQLLLLFTLVWSIGIYMFVKYFYIMCAYFYMWKFGSFWKMRLAMHIIPKEIDAARLIFRVAGDKVYRKFFHVESLVVLGGFCTSAAVVMAVRELWKRTMAQVPDVVVEQQSQEYGAECMGVAREKTPAEEYVWTSRDAQMDGRVDDIMADADRWEIEQKEKKLLKELAAVAKIARKKENVKMAKLDEKRKLMKQGGLLSTGLDQKLELEMAEKSAFKPVPGVVPRAGSEEKPTFYFNDPYKIGDIDLSDSSRCSQGDLLKKVENNLARLIFRFDDSVGMCSSTTAVNVTGSIWMFAAHVLKCTKGTVDVIFEDVSQNVSRNHYGIFFSAHDITRVEGQDVCFIDIRAIPPGRNLIKYFPKNKQLQGVFAGTYSMIGRNGVREQRQVENIRPRICPFSSGPAYSGRAATDTADGDCGSPCVIKVGNAEVILGLHSAGGIKGHVVMQHISQDLIHMALTGYTQQVECGYHPISGIDAPRELGPVHFKSPIRFVPRGVARVMGSFKGYRPHHKTSVCDSFIKKAVEADGYGTPGLPAFGPPDMSWRPWAHAINDMTAPRYTFHNQILDRVKNAFLDELVNGLGDKIKDLEVYTQDVALNGVDGVAYVDRINCNTSAGNPYKKSKMNYLDFDKEGRIVGVDERIQARINEIEECYSHGRMYHPQFCDHLKDEALAARKIAKGSTRVFSGGEMAWSIVVRRFFLSHIRLIQNNQFLFEAMPGVVAQSSEWQDLHDYVTRFGIKRLIAGDYGKFDKKMVAAFILAAFDILIELAKKAGWAEDSLMVLRCIAYDTAFPTMDFNGDYIQVQGNPSGHPLTVIINCLVNSLYMRYAFHKVANRPVEDFKKYVNLATYGDDNLMGVSEDVSGFDHTTIAVALSLIGVEYTMADKEAESRPFVGIDEVTFLKRGFVWDDDMKTTLGPIDHSSIVKMLTTRMDNGGLTPQAHACGVIDTALREYFFYGKEKFEERRVYFRELLVRLDLEKDMEVELPTYDIMVEDFWKRSGNKN